MKPENKKTAKSKIVGQKSNIKQHFSLLTKMYKSGKFKVPTADILYNSTKSIMKEGLRNEKRK